MTTDITTVIAYALMRVLLIPLIWIAPLCLFRYFILEP